MHIPRYWAKGTFQTVDPHGRPLDFACWGWSDDSRDDALRCGRERAEGVAQRYLSEEAENPHGYYGVNPLREEVLRDLGGGRHGNPRAVITRNRYGCHVLNVERIMFVDVDLAEPSAGARLAYWVRRNLLRKPATPPSTAIESEALAKLETLTRASRHIGARVYRTRAGLRYLFTSDFADPKSDAVHDTMRFLGADPLFMRLCLRQECFRARLTPKPWRCAVHNCTITYPRADAAAEDAFRQWDARYAEATRPYAVCRFVGTFGTADIHPAISPIVRLHDDMTGVATELPLA